MTLDPVSCDALAVLDVDLFLDAVRARLDESLRFAGRLGVEGFGDLDASDLARVTTLEECIGDLVAAGGKLVRPRLVRLGYIAMRDHGASDRGALAAPSALVDVAAAFELLHVFGLLQDDVMDGSTMRRGRVAAHRRVTGHVVDARGALSDTGPDGSVGPGDHTASRVGESVAVLAGDLAFALAQRLVRGVPPRVADAWDETVVELVQGQRLDLLFAAEGRLDEQSTMRVAQAKSGAYTVLRPLETGALLAGVETVPDWLTACGIALGEAFALADDVIGIWGDPVVTGKPVGEDLRERKPSTVIGIADALLDGALTQRLAPHRPPLRDDEVSDLVDRMDRCGARAEARRRIETSREIALAAIQHVADPDVRAQFERLAHEISTRDA